MLLLGSRRRTIRAFKLLNATFLAKLMEKVMTLDAKMTLATPAQLPPEWRELLEGVAAQHECTATARLTGDGIYVELSSEVHGDNIRSLAHLIGTEMEKALARPSRMATSHTMNVFINNGQAAAMGPNAVAHGTTFQQRSDDAPDQQLAIIRSEAERMGKHAEQLNAALYYDWWQQILADKFRPADLEDAIKQARAATASDAVLVSELDKLRATTKAADEEADRILDRRAHSLEPLRALSLRAYHSAFQVVSGVDRLKHARTRR